MSRRHNTGPSGMIEITARFTPEQFAVIARLCELVGESPKDYVTAIACSEARSWGSFREFADSVPDDIEEFVRNREVPAPHFWASP